MSNFTETLKCPYRSPHVAVEAIRDIIKDKVVCELGCGYGDLFPSFAKYAKEVKGLEFDKERVAVCKEKGLSVIHGDWTKDPIPKADVYYFWAENTSQVEPLIDLLIPQEKTIIAAADASYKEEGEVSTWEHCKQKWTGELRRFPFDEGDEYRENGEFVLLILP
jgi:SAM-dependent methyltransferase